MVVHYRAGPGSLLAEEEELHILAVEEEARRNLAEGEELRILAVGGDSLPAVGGSLAAVGDTAVAVAVLHMAAAVLEGTVEVEEIRTLHSPAGLEGEHHMEVVVEEGIGREEERRILAVGEDTLLEEDTVAGHMGVLESSVQRIDTRSPGFNSRPPGGGAPYWLYGWLG